jgi:hypothetical protein
MKNYSNIMHSCFPRRHSIDQNARTPSLHGRFNRTRSIRWALYLLFLSLLTGCFIPAPSFPQKRFGSDQELPIQALTVSFADTYFQPRWASFTYRSDVPVFWYGPEGFSQRFSSRLQSNDFEKMLGEFDVFEYFNDQLNLRASDSKFVKLKLTGASDLVPKIIELAKCKEKDRCSLAVERVSGLTDHIAVLKVSYGIAIRPGPEQFGFTKYYRPFIRVLGILKNSHSVETLWQQDICVFGDDRYSGDDSEAYALPRERIISSFKKISSTAIEFLTLSLNGQGLPPMPAPAPSGFSDISF